MSTGGAKARALRILSAPYRGVKWLAVGCADRTHEAWINLSARQRANVQAWFWYTFVLSSLPIVITLGVKYVANADDHPVRWGDLYLVSGLIAFAGLGLMAAEKEQRPGLGLNRGGATLILGILDIVMYVAVAGSHKPHSAAVDVTSGMLYVLSAVASLSCAVASASGG